MVASFATPTAEGRCISRMFANRIYSPRAASSASRLTISPCSSSASVEAYPHTILCSASTLLVHPLSEMRLLWFWSVTRGTGPGWGGCDDPSGARIERGGGAQAGADDALTETRRGAGPPCADYPARG